MYKHMYIHTIHMKICAHDTGGKPSTWLPPEEVEVQALHPWFLFTKKIINESSPVGTLEHHRTFRRQQGSPEDNGAMPGAIL